MRCGVTGVLFRITNKRLCDEFWQIGPSRYFTDAAANRRIGKHDEDTGANSRDYLNQVPHKRPTLVNGLRGLVSC